MTKLYLKTTIKAEPLIWQWYAWPYLIPPLTAACNIVDRHLKIMQSYVQNPKIHAEAAKDPKLIGGPFINFEKECIDQIKTLINDTNETCKELIALDHAFKNFDRTLQNNAQGDSLESYYEKIPDSLKGMVELVYNLNSHPAIRIVEPILYKKYYSTQHQKIALSESKKDHREFVLSTPRLDQEEEVYLNVPFSDSRLDTLFSMKTEPSDVNEIKNLFDIPSVKEELFISFFSSSPPISSGDCKYKGNGIRIRYFGHACVLVETDSVSILFDPVISYPLQTNNVPRYTLSDLPNHIDYVVITHNHQDHVLFETLLQLRHKIGHIVIPSNTIGSVEDPSLKLIFKHTGFHSVIELKEMDSIKLINGELIGLPFFGEHADLNIQTKLSYCLKLKNKKFMFAADSNNLDPALYDHIFDFIGPIDTLFLGMECDGAPLTWLYGPLLSTPIKRSFDRSRTLSGSNFEKAWTIVEKSHCKAAYVYAMGQEPWLNHIMALEYSPDSVQITESDKFVQACRDKKIDSERLFGKREWIIS